MGTEDCNVTTLTKKMDTPQSTISQHLSKLKSYGIIEGTRNGVEIQYNVVNDEVKKIIHLLLQEFYETDSLEETIEC